MLYGCKRKMALAKSRALTREDGASPSEWRQNLMAGLGKLRMEQGSQTVRYKVHVGLWYKSRCVLPSRLKFREESHFGPGVIRALVQCALEGEGAEEVFPTGKSRCRCHNEGREIKYHAHITSAFFSQQIRSSDFCTNTRPWQWVPETSKVGQNLASGIFERTGFPRLTSVFAATLKAKVTTCRKQNLNIHI